MAKTVLEYVQTALATMDSDDVDSISDTVESDQVATFLKEVYYELLNREEWDFLDGPAQLVSAADVSEPTEFTIAADTRKIHEIRYDLSYPFPALDVNLRKLTYIEPLKFLQMFAREGDNTVTVNRGGAGLFYNIPNDRHPERWTSFDDGTVTLDAFNADAGFNYLPHEAISMWASVIPPFTLDDAFEPDIPLHMEPLLQSSLNAVSHLYLKQAASGPDETRVRRQLAQARRAHSKIKNENYFNRRYGRR